MLYCAHSGFDATPDNSIASLRAGAAAGFPCAEIDVRLTPDGHVVLHHDDEIHGQDGALRISKTPWAPLHAQVPALVSLSDALETVRALGLSLNVDLKDATAAPYVAEACVSMGIASTCYFSGLEPEQAAWVAAQKLPVRHLLNVPGYLAEEQDPSVAIQKAVNFALETGAFGLNLYHRMVWPALIDRAHRSFLWVWAWTVNEASDAQKLADMGVDGITTRVRDILPRT